MTEEQYVILKADIDDVNKKLDSLLGKTNTTASAMQSSFVRMANQIAMAIGVAFSVNQLVQFGKQSVEEFKVMQLSAIELANTLKNIGVPPSAITSIQDMVSNLSKVSLFKPEEINSVLIDLVRRFGDVGLAVKALPVVIEGARNGIGDLTTTENELVLGVQNANAGITTAGRGLKDFGITITKGKDATQLLDEAMLHVKGSTDAYTTSLAGTESVGTLAITSLKNTIGSKLAPAIEGINLGLATQIGLWTASGVAGTNGMASIRDVSFTLVNIIGALGDSVVEFLKTWYQLTAHPLGIGIDFKGLEEEWKQVGKEWKTVFTLPPTNTTNATEALDAIEKKALELLKSLGLVGNSIDDNTNSANAFKAAWASINIQGLNVPELTKFVGNLNMATIPKTTPTPQNQSKLDITLTINMSNKESAVGGGYGAQVQTSWHGQGLGQLAPLQPGVLTPLQPFVSHGTVYIPGGR
jgi:hypothetical protein